VGHRVHVDDVRGSLCRRPIGFVGNRECGYSQGLPEIILAIPLSQEWVKLRNSDFVCTFIGSIGTKAGENFRKK